MWQQLLGIQALLHLLPPCIVSQQSSAALLHTGKVYALLDCDTCSGAEFVFFNNRTPLALSVQPFLVKNLRKLGL